MDNKLSELSKPVAWTTQEYVSALLAELEASKTNAEYYKSAFEEQRDYADKFEKQLVAKDKRIAELENDEVRQRLANAEHQLHMAELRAHNARAGRIAQFRKRKAAEQRMAEMESVVAAAKCDDELWGAMAHRLKTLEDKLATPVRLPVVLMGYQSDDYRLGFMEGVEKSGEEVRSAGFTVEGDE